MSSLNGKVSVDQFVIQSLYYRYKDFLVPVGTIGVCLVLFFMIIIPQLQNFLATRDTIGTDTQKLSVLQQNLNAVTLLDDSALTSYLATASKALPAEKDPASIITSLSTAAALAGSSLGDYSFQIGDVAGSDAKIRGQQQPLQLQVNISGGLSEAVRFIADIKKQLPLADVIAVAVNANNTVSVTIIFYYSPLPKIQFDDSVPLPVLSATDQKTLQDLAASDSIAASLQQTTVGSSSATAQ